MNNFFIPPQTSPSDWGMTYDKIKRLTSSDQRSASNSIMPGLLSQRGYANTVWLGAVTDMIERGVVGRRPIVKENQVNPKYVSPYPLYPEELPELMREAGETPADSRVDNIKKVSGNPGLAAKLWRVKGQRDVDDCQAKYPGSCAMQLGFLADKWDLDARHLKTNYRAYGGMMT